MKLILKQSTFTAFIVLGTYFLLGSQSVLAHSRADLSKQVESCYWTWGGGYSEYINCGYGKAEVHFENMYATDLARDTHCAYTRRYNESTDRFVEVKSCGSTKRGRVSGSKEYREYAACITGHWYCYWEQ